MKFKSNKYYIIVSLENPKAILDTYESIIKRLCDFKGLDCEYVPIEYSYELMNCLDRIKEETEQDNSYPHIHLEMHGSKDGLKLNSPIRITWEVLSSKLKEVNGVSGNNLVVSMAVCYGAYFSFELLKSLNEKNECRAPALCIICPDDEIEEGHVNDSFHYFFQNFLNSRSLHQAIEELKINSDPDNKIRIISCEDVYEQFFMLFMEEQVKNNLTNRNQVAKRLDMIIRDFIRMNTRKPTNEERNMIFQNLISEEFYKDFCNNIRNKYFWIDKHPDNEKRFGQLEFNNWNEGITEKFLLR